MIQTPSKIDRFFNCILLLFIFIQNVYLILNDKCSLTFCLKRQNKIYFFETYNQYTQFKTLNYKYTKIIDLYLIFVDN